MEYYIGIDIGGTSIKYGLLDGSGKILLKKSRDTEAQKGGASILEKVEEIVEEFCAEYSVSGVCISTAGMVDCRRGEIFYAGELIPGYTGTALKETVERRFEIPCEVENDVNCAGIAEAEAGAAKGASSAVCLTVGTGIGGCLLINGEVFHGFSNSACEIGYMKMRDSDYQTLGASSILSRKVAGKKQSLTEEWQGVRIFAEAEMGDEVCRTAIEEMADILAEGIANICYMINPEVVVIGGGIAAQETYLKPLIQKRLPRYLKKVILEKTRIEFAHLRNDAGMQGAFYHFMEYQKKRKNNFGDRAKGC